MKWLKYWASGVLATSKNPKKEFKRMVFFYVLGMAIAIASLIWFPTLAVFLIILVLIVEFLKKKIFG